MGFDEVEAWCYLLPGLKELVKQAESALYKRAQDASVSFAPETKSRFVYKRRLRARSLTKSLCGIAVKGGFGGRCDNGARQDRASRGVVGAAETADDVEMQVFYPVRQQHRREKIQRQKSVESLSGHDSGKRRKSFLQ